jgi:predicted NAD/FAD-binding protein
MTSPLQQKIKITGPSVVTANRTWDGVVIYRTAGQDWSTDLADAAVVTTADPARALLTEATADDLGAIGAYIAPVTLDDAGTIAPGNLREKIRHDGVTIALPVSA